MLEIDEKLVAGLSSMGASFLISILEIAQEQYQIDPDELLDEIGLTKDKIEPVGARVPAYYLSMLFMSILKRSQDEHLALRIGQKTELKSFHILGYVLMNARDIRECVERLIRYEKLLIESSMTTFEEADGECSIQWHNPYQGPEGRHFSEIILTGWICISRRMTNSTLTINRVNYSHSPPSDISNFEKVYGCPVYFDQPFCSVEFSSPMLDSPIQAADPVLSDIMKKHADKMLLDYDTSINFVSEVRGIIFQLMPGGELSMDKVAEQIRLSNRVIHNRLKKHGVTFNDLVDEVRRILALFYIEDDSVSLVNIGLLLGFADQSSFTRAFKRWQGETPGDYRKSSRKRQNDTT
ncbi:MAG: AraC family transcriptional regulator [Pseudomonadales bacterium]|nr:AraC family transcriptional regulator [Pseudomonadales bacterium]